MFIPIVEEVTVGGLQIDEHSNGRCGKRYTFAPAVCTRIIVKGGITVQKVGCIGIKHNARDIQQNTVKNKLVHTHYAKCSTDNSTASLWHLLIEEFMLCHIQKCAEAKAFILLQDKHWALSAKELYTFIALIYTHNSSFTEGMMLSDLWELQWVAVFIAAAVGQTRLWEIITFLMCDRKTREHSIHNQRDLL